jgi:hypothetical protein
MKTYILIFSIIVFSTPIIAQNKVSIFGYGGSAFANEKVGFDFGLGVNYDISQVIALSLSGESLTFRKLPAQEFTKFNLNAEITPKHKNSTFLSSNIGTSLLTVNKSTYLGLDIGLKLNQKIKERLFGSIWINTNFNKVLNGIIQTNLCLKYKL